MLDTNILLRLSQPSHPHGRVAQAALNRLRLANENLHITSQNLVEYWAVATRPVAENGLGLTPEDASRDLAGLKLLFALLPELPLQEIWERLVTGHRILGKNTHDARLVAAMMANQVETILTFNGEDFARYSEIAVLDPRTIL